MLVLLTNILLRFKQSVYAFALYFLLALLVPCIVIDDHPLFFNTLMSGILSLRKLCDNAKRQLSLNFGILQNDDNYKFRYNTLTLTIH